MFSNYSLTHIPVVGSARHVCISGSLLALLIKAYPVKYGLRSSTAVIYTLRLVDTNLILGVCVCVCTCGDACLCVFVYSFASADQCKKMQAAVEQVIKEAGIKPTVPPAALSPFGGRSPSAQPSPQTTVSHC